MAEPVTLTVERATRLAAQALAACNTATANAESTARALVDAEVDGQAGHGLSRVPSYAAQARVGKVDGAAQPEVIQTAPSVVRVDAHGGFAYPAVDLAIEALAPLARRCGVAGAGIYASHHFGQAGRHVERLACKGLVAIAMSNTPKAMAFPAASGAMLGTNPIAFAAPLPGRPPLVIDMALSQVARGRIVAAHKAGRSIPPDWATDAAGEPTTDAGAALEGALLPMGGPKGAALALMVEVLCAALVGGRFGWEATSFLDAEGDAPRVGHLLIAFDPMAFAGEAFPARMAAMLEAATTGGGRLPGDRRLAARARAAAEGLSLPAALHREICSLAGQAQGVA